MQVTAVYAALAQRDYGLKKAFNTVIDTLMDLGITTRTISLNDYQLPFFGALSDGKVVTEIMSAIEQGDALIFAGTVLRSAPCALLMTFLEHFESPKYHTLLQGKSCMLITASMNGGDRRAIDAMSEIIGAHGAYDVIRFSAGNDQAAFYGDELKLIIEKQAEDFFRLIRSVRKFTIAQDFLNSPVLNQPPYVEELAEQLAIESTPEKTGPKHKTSDLYEKLKLNTLNTQQASEVNEITDFFAGVLSSKGLKIEPKAKTYDASGLPEPAARREKNCRRLVQAIPGYHQAEHSLGLSAVFQFSISGSESFDGYITVKDSQCDYNDGIAVRSDISILADADIISDILRGKYTAQKAFMVGQLKVRGNFLLLTKFDQIFELKMA